MCGNTECKMHRVWTIAIIFYKYYLKVYFDKLIKIAFQIFTK